MPTTDRIKLVEAVDLHRSFNDVKAVDGVSISIASGEIYGLIGPDGAGKTTTLRLLCGAYLPTSGNSTIKIAGYDVQKETEQARTEIGYLPQRFSLYEEMTVLENLRFFAEVRGLSRSEWMPRSIQILEFVGLAEFTNRRAGQLSGGMKQKLGLAAALVHNPRVLLLDEPTTGVDPVTRQDFWQLIIRLVAGEEDGGHKPALLVSTPYMDEAARCSHVAFMQQGRIKIEGTPAELRASLEGQILEIIGQPLPYLRQLTAADEDIMDVQMFGDRLHVRVAPDQLDDVITRFDKQFREDGLQITRMRPIATQLEDVFMSLMEQG